MEEESIQKPDGSDAQSHRDEPAKVELSEKHSAGGGRVERKGLGWTVWLLVVLIVFLLVSSLASLVVSHRAYESAQKQVKAIEELTQSIRDIQRSIVNLSRMLEQAPSEEEEPEEDAGNSGDGSI
jgi:cell division protein FtsB